MDWLYWLFMAALIFGCAALVWMVYSDRMDLEDMQEDMDSLRENNRYLYNEVSHMRHFIVNCGHLRAYYAYKPVIDGVKVLPSPPWDDDIYLPEVQGKGSNH